MRIPHCTVGLEETGSNGGDARSGARFHLVSRTERRLNERLPIVVTTSEKAEHASFLAYANGARTCLKRPLSVMVLAKAIADVTDCAASSASRGPNDAYDLVEERL
jgi:hypothetical protein